MASYHVYSGSEINHRMISEAIQLDRLSYSDIYQLQVETCYEYFEKNNDIYIMAVDDDTGNVIGYINFSPIMESVFRELVFGNTIDTVITSNNVASYSNGNIYWGYFSSIVVHPDYRQQGIATHMLLRWSEFIFFLATERDIFFEKIVADAVSSVGEHLLSEIGFSFTKLSNHKSRIMTLDLFGKNLSNWESNEKLMAVYRKYKEKEGTIHVI